MALKGPAFDFGSLLQAVASTLAIDPVRAQVQLIDAGDMARIEREGANATGLFTGTFLRPMLIVDVVDPDRQDAVVRFLSRHLPAAHVMTVFLADSWPAGQSRTAAELPDSDESILALYVPPLDEQDATSDPRRIQQIVARLRAADGCPWDRVQTHRSLRDAVIDEAYEVTDAIDSGDLENLAEELGDLLLLTTMHAQIAAEAGAFTIEDVQRLIATKLVGRHPHVFGDDRAETEADLARIWKEAKARERAANPNKGGSKALDGEPRSMPALTRAARVLRKHPLPANPGLSTPEQRAERLLWAVAAIVAVDDDPDAVLRAALVRHIGADTEHHPAPVPIPDASEMTPRK